MAEFSIAQAQGRPERQPELPAQVQGFKPVIDATGWVLKKVPSNGKMAATPPRWSWRQVQIKSLI